MFRLLECGTEAVLIECDSLDAVELVAASLRAAAADGSGVWAAVADIVPASRTVLVHFTRTASVGRSERDAVRQVVTHALTMPAGHRAPSDAADEVQIAVHYDGPDLEAVAAHTGLSVAEVVAAHTGTPWRVAFSGFAPGFGYLVGGDPRLDVPRLATPRTAVPAGSVGLAGRFSGIYPQASPGGWQLIGRTDAVLFDPNREPPALLRPGALIRFRSVDADALGASTALTAARPGVPEAAGATRSALIVERVGLPVLIQDLGRAGQAQLGVPASGAADQGAYALGARLLGHTNGEAALEITLGGLTVRAVRSCTVVLTGADPHARLDGRPAPFAAPFVLTDGQVLELGSPLTGMRSYLSVRGGIVVPAVLGSRSCDTLSGLGPPPVQVGDRLPVGPAAHGWRPLIDLAPVRRPSGDELRLAATLGPRDDWFADPGALSTTWHVSSASDRVGVRLTGKPLPRTQARIDDELPSEAMVRGAVQVPPDGQPVVLLADYPVTGGYPVIAVLTPDSVDRLAQARPGQAVRFVVAQAAPKR